MRKKIIIPIILSLVSLTAWGQEIAKTASPEDTEIYSPVPKVITPGMNLGDAPSDALILFDGTNLNQWVSSADHNSATGWVLGKGYFTVKKGTSNIESKQKFLNYQLHIEWKIPENISGSGQARGNSGVFLASTGSGDAGYELQVLDGYQNKTYVNGMVGSIYKQYVPLVNPARKPGEWQNYDIIWTAPQFNKDSTLSSPAKATVFFNGVLVQNNITLKGETRYIGQPFYKEHGACPIKLQAHGDKSEPISFRNIWIRNL
jgi:hypothetical protein